MWPPLLRGGMANTLLSSQPERTPAMFWNRQAFVVAASAFALTFAFSLPGNAEPKVTTVNANVVNSTSNPIPVVIQRQGAQEPISFREGYQVPIGKRLLID